MTRTLLAAMLLAAPAFAPAAAQDEEAAGPFSEGSEANSWGLFAEEPARFEARVVDLLCELAGECPDECDGDRQLGLVRAADDVLVLPMKNNQPVFSGAAVDLAPFCGQTVEVDGLLVEDPEIQGAVNVYLVQRVLGEGEDEWTTANRFTQAWMEENPEEAGGGPWFRRDPRVNAMIEAEGHLGLGLEADEAFIRELFE